MVTNAGITENLKSLGDLQRRCNLQQAESDRFFNEWIDALPQLNQNEQTGVARTKQRYDYHTQH